MSKKAYPLRIGEDVLEAVRRWSEDELRSMNAQIEYVLRDALRKAGRLPRKPVSDSGKESKD
jgi:hypothetical protein